MTSTSSASVRGSLVKSSLIWPASQSRFSEESGPPHWFFTATVSVAQLKRTCQIPRSNLSWSCAGMPLDMIRKKNYSVIPGIGVIVVGADILENGFVVL